MRKHLRLSILYFLSFTLLFLYACKPRNVPSEFSQVEENNGFRNLNVVIEEGGGGGEYFECLAYEDLSILDYLQDEEQLWNYYLNQTHIAQLYTFDPREKPLDSISETTNYPFTRVIKMPAHDIIGDEVALCWESNPNYYRPFFLPQNEFVNLAELPEAELALFKAVYEHQYLATLKQQLPDRVRSAVRSILQQQLADIFYSKIPATVTGTDSILSREIYDQIQQVVNEQYAALSFEVELYAFARFDREFAEAFSFVLEMGNTSTLEGFIYSLSWALISDSISFDEPSLPSRLASFRSKLEKQQVEYPIHTILQLEKLLEETDENAIITARKRSNSTQATFLETPYPTGVQVSYQDSVFTGTLLKTAYQYQSLRLNSDSLQRVSSGLEVAPIASWAGATESFYHRFFNYNGRYQGYRDILRAWLPGRQQLQQFRKEKLASTQLRHQLLSNLLAYDEKIFLGNPPDANATTSAFYRAFTSLYIEMVSARHRLTEMVWEKTDKTIAALRESELPEIQKSIQQIDSLDNFSSTMELRYITAIKYGDQVQLETAVDLRKELATELEAIFGQIQSLDARIEKMEAEWKQAPKKIWQDGEAEMAVQVITDARKLANYCKAYFTLARILPADDGQTSDILAVARALGRLPNYHTGPNFYGFTLAEKRTAFHRQIKTLHANFELEETTAFCRIKALEAAYSSCRDLYREKLAAIFVVPE